MRIRILDTSDVDSLLAFLARAEVAAYRVTDWVIEIETAEGVDPESARQEIALLLGVWKAMHPGSGFVWA